MLTKNYILILFSSFTVTALSQKAFTRKDSLQGGLRFERTCFDVQHYNLNIKVDIDKKAFKVLMKLHLKLLNPLLKFNWICLKT